MRRLPRLHQRGQKRLITLDQARFARLAVQLAQLHDEIISIGRLSLESLDELQTAHEPKSLGLNLWWSRPAPMLGVKTADPGLMKLSRFHQESLGGERFAIGRLHEFCAKDTPLIRGLPGTLRYRTLKDGDTAWSTRTRCGHHWGTGRADSSLA